MNTSHFSLRLLVWCAWLPLPASGTTQSVLPVSTLERQFWQASACGDVPQLRALLARGLDANTAQQSGWTALMFAAVANRSPAVHFLLQQGARIDQKTRRDNQTALAIVAQTGNLAMVKLLIARGANVNALDSGENTVLMVVIGNGNLSEGKTLSIVKQLLQSGADVKAVSSIGNTALSVAQQDKPAVAKLLRAYGVRE